MGEQIRWIRTQADGSSETLCLVRLPEETPVECLEARRTDLAMEVYTGNAGAQGPRGDHCGLYDLDGERLDSPGALEIVCPGEPGTDETTLEAIEGEWSSGTYFVERVA